jgi:hypothetical protein
VRLGIAEEALPHDIEANDKHPSDSGIHRAAFQQSNIKFCGRKVLCVNASEGQSAA